MTSDNFSSVGISDSPLSEFVGMTSKSYVSLVDSDKEEEAATRSGSESSAEYSEMS
jgi:hypothetical protein